MTGTVRDYAVLYLGPGGKKVATVGGGNAVIGAGQHRLDGTEHLAPADTTTLDATASAHGLLPKLSGDAGDALLGDGTWGVLGGDVATDAIWDAAGDLAVGSGANTAAKLTAGSEADVLTIASGVPAWAAAAAGSGGVTVHHTYTKTSANTTTTSASMVAVDATDNTFSKSVAIASNSRVRLTFIGAVGQSSASTIIMAPAIDGAVQVGSIGPIYSSEQPNRNLSFSWITEPLAAATYVFAIFWRVSGGTATLRSDATIGAYFAVEEIKA